MADKERVAVEQAVTKLARSEVFVLSVYPRNVAVHLQIALLCRNKEVGYDVVAFGRFVAEHARTCLQLHLLFCLSVVVEKEVEVPLHHVSGIGKLLIECFFADARVALIVFGVANIVDVVCASLGKDLIAIDMIYLFAVCLVFQFGWQLVVFAANKFVDDVFEHNFEALYQEVFALIGVHSDLSGFVEKGKAEVPKLQGFV